MIKTKFNVCLGHKYLRSVRVQDPVVRENSHIRMSCHADGWWACPKPIGYCEISIKL